MNLNKFYPLITFLLSLTVYGAEKKKVLFLDLNRSESEIKVAKEMAKKKGEELIIYPRNDDYLNLNDLEKIISKNKFRSLILSGHNGGKTYEGDNGRLVVSQLISMLDKSGNTEIESLYLLGCNSANKSKMFFWKSSLPNLKFIAGYDGTAPLSSVQVGLNYFRDTMAKESKLINSKDKKSLKSSLSGIKDINQLNSSIYISCQEGENPQEYVFLSQTKNNQRFSEFNAKECAERIIEFKKNYSEKIRQYWEAELEPTLENTKDGFTRKAYTFMRQNAHCLESNDGNNLITQFTGDSLLFLLFNKSFNHNFSEYYKELISDSLNQITKNLEHPDIVADEIMEKTKVKNEVLKETLANFNAFSDKNKKEIQRLESDLEKLRKDNPGLIECLNSISGTCPAHLTEASTQYISTYSTLGLLHNITKDNIEMFLTFSDKRSKNDIINSIKEDESTLKESQLILTKMQTNPENVTRSDILELSHNLNIPGPQSTSSLGLKMALTGAEQLSDSFPFSWHERKSNSPIEPPSYNLQMKQLSKSFFFIPEDKDLKVLIESMTGM
jgi:hypothetical protein